MGFSNRSELVPAVEVINTKEMALKILQAKKQECKSRINRAKQEMEDLKVAKIAELEYQILHAEAELDQLLKHEKVVVSSEEAK